MFLDACKQLRLHKQCCVYWMTSERRLLWRARSETEWAPEGLTWSWWCSLQKVSAQKIHAGSNFVCLLTHTNTNAPRHLPDTCCQSCHTWTAWSETSFQLQEKRRGQSVLNERRELVSSVIPTVNKLDWQLCFLPRRPLLPRELITGFGGWPRGQQWHGPLLITQLPCQLL